MKGLGYFFVRRQWSVLVSLMASVMVSRGGGETGTAVSACHYCPLIVAVCSQPSHYPHPTHLTLTNSLTNQLTSEGVRRRRGPSIRPPLSMALLLSKYLNQLFRAPTL